MSSHSKPSAAAPTSAPPNVAGALARAAISRLIGAFRVELDGAGWTARAASLHLGHGPGYLTKVFNGHRPLTMKAVFGLLRLLGKEPLFFFAAAFPLSEAKEPGKLASGLDLNATVARLVRLADAQALDRPAEEWVEDTRAALRAEVVASGRKFRAVSRALELKTDALSHVFRGRANLLAFHMLGSLGVLGVSPGAFFAELCRPPEGMPWWREVVAHVDRAGRAERGKAGGEPDHQ